MGENGRGMGRLDRFHEAQADPHAGFAAALREMRLRDDCA